MQDGTLKTRKSLVTNEHAEAVRAKLTPAENIEVDDKMLNQFLRATKQDIEKAAKRLKDTIAWRQREQPHKKVCKKCVSLPRAHFMHVVSCYPHDPLDCFLSVVNIVENLFCRSIDCSTCTGRSMIKLAI